MDRIVQDVESSLVVVRVAHLACAFAIEHVVETMRPLPVQPLAGAPSCVVGLAIVRGEPVPVVDLAAVLGVVGSARARWLTLRAGDRRVAVLVDEVVEVRTVGATALGELPPLLQAGEIVQRIGTADAALVVVLDAARLVARGTERGIERSGANA